MDGGMPSNAGNPPDEFIYTIRQVRRLSSFVISCETRGAGLLIIIPGSWSKAGVACELPLSAGYSGVI